MISTKSLSVKVISAVNGTMPLFARVSVTSRVLYPLWIADMDFTSPPAVIDGFRRIVEHGTFGYTVL